MVQTPEGELIIFPFFPSCPCASLCGSTVVVPCCTCEIQRRLLLPLSIFFK